MKKIFKLSYKIINTKQFFIAILALVILQSGWYALSFKTSQFDEVFHYRFISMYSEQDTPFVKSQDTKWDDLGDTTRYPSYLYHYTMSIPLKATRSFLKSERAQVTLLRIINIGFFVAALAVYRKLLEKIGASEALSNVILLFVALIPNFSILAGTINYDNLIFLFSGTLLLAAQKIITARKVDFTAASTIVSIGLLVCLIKFSFIALLIPVIAWTTYILIRKHGKKTLRLLARSYKETPKVKRTLLIALVALSCILVIERQGFNLFKYRELKPACQAILSQQRCEKNFVASRNIKLLAAKQPGFKPAPPTWYSGIWLESMTSTSLKIVQSKPAPLLLGLLFIFGVPLGLALMLIYMRETVKTDVDRLMYWSAISYALVVFVNNYLIYVKYSQPIAMNGRYLLPVIPILLYYLSKSILILINHKKELSITFAAVVFICMSQGGGLTTHLVVTGKGAYWDEGNGLIGKTSLKTGDLLSKFIIERSIFSK